MSSRLISLAPLAVAVSLAACKPQSGVSSSDIPVNPSALSPLVVRIDAMDNAAHTLRGSIQGDTADTRIELYENSVLLGEARVEDSHWSIEWHPQVDSQSIEVVASSAAGQESRAHLDLQPLRFDTPSSLYVPATLLSLPTSATTKTYYTLDGSTPTTASALYDGPLVLLRRQEAVLSLLPTNPLDSPEDWRWQPPQLPLTLANVVRVQQYQGTSPSGVGQARTYLMGDHVYSLPVMSLVTDGSAFFDYTTGIYVPGKVHDDNPVPQGAGVWGTGNYMQDGKAWERPVHVEWFEPSGQLLLSQNAGVRIHGSNSAVLPQKSLRLYARSDSSPGSDSFTAPFFPDSSLHDFKRLIVRSGGQDSLDSKIRDCALQGLMTQTDLSLQACRPAIVFLDGEYWGVHEVRERYDEYYLAAHDGVDPAQVVIVDGEGVLDTGSSGDERSYLALKDFVSQQDLSIRDNYEYVRTQMDVDDFIDYMIAEIYFGNQDWPDNNTKVWHVRTASKSPTTAGQDGRWRWILYDLDFTAHEGPEQDDLERILTDNFLSTRGPAVLLKGLLRSPDFTANFVQRFRWHLDNTFTPEKVRARLDTLSATLAPEMEEHTARWHYPASVDDWRADVSWLYDYFDRRPALMRQMLDARFGPP